MEFNEVRIGMQVTEMNHPEFGIGQVQSFDSDHWFQVSYPRHTGSGKYWHTRAYALTEVKEEKMDELKFGDRCMAWDDGRDKDEHIFICKTPTGVMVADVDEFSEEIVHDMEGLMGGEYWFGFYKHVDPVEVREMTVAEIEEALGFSIKIVKEDK